MRNAPRPMPIGEYLRKRREADRVSIEDVECLVASGNGRLSAPLAELEAGPAQPLGLDIAMLSIAGAFEFDESVAFHLLAGDPQRVCRECACSEWDPCIDDLDGAGSCAWVEEDLCSRCAVPAVKAA